MNKTRTLNELLNSKNVEYICEAHNAISAKIVQEAGFGCIWGSSLTITAAKGMRDCSEISTTELKEVANDICNVVDIPLLLDIDSGFGNFNNARMLAKSLYRIGVAGVCIEDKLFPKINSFADSAIQTLEEQELFCNKIRAIREAVPDENFCIIGRTEVLIQKNGRVDEALCRAKAYQEAGATAVFVHSKKNNFDEITSFMDRWDMTCPIVVAPTTYYQTTHEEFSQAGVSMVIWANQILRASIHAMREAAESIYKISGVVKINDRIVSVNDVFALQNMKELAEAEAKFLQQKKNT